MQWKSKEEERHNCSGKVECTRERGELRQKPFPFAVHARARRQGIAPRAMPIYFKIVQNDIMNGDGCNDRQV